MMLNFQLNYSFAFSYQTIMIFWISIADMEGHIRIRIDFQSNKFLQVAFFDTFVHTAVCPRDRSHGAFMLTAWRFLYLRDVSFVDFHLNHLELQTGVSFLRALTVSEFLNAVVSKTAILSENIL